MCVAAYGNSARIPDVEAAFVSFLEKRAGCTSRLRSYLTCWAWLVLVIVAFILTATPAVRWFILAAGLNNQLCRQNRTGQQTASIAYYDQSAEEVNLDLYSSMVREGRTISTRLSTFIEVREGVGKFRAGWG